MRVSEALDYINNTINNTVNAYKLTKDSKDADGNYIAHPLEAKTDDDKLDALKFGLYDAVTNTKPLKLLEQSGSNATEFKPLSSVEYIRVPNTPTIDGNLDIDEGLSFAVIYEALTYLWSGYSLKATDAKGIYASHNDMTRDYFFNRDALNVETQPVYFRYSVDGSTGSWHDTFQDGDLYISFKQGTGEWSNPIKFVGEDGSGGSGGASTFLDLTDTPSAFTADKWLKVNSDGTALIETDAPTATLTYAMNGSDSASGDIIMDLRAGHGNETANYLFATGDLTVDISKTDSDYDMDIGRTYILEIFPEGYNCTINFTAKGDITIDSSKYAHLLQFIYDGEDIFIINNVSY